jgi:predicted nucleic acid-binding protein
MAADPAWRVFLDTSVWVAGIASERGAAREILRLAEAGLVRVVASERVLVELDRVIAAKLPEFNQDLRSFIARVHPEVMEDPKRHDLQPYRGLIEEGDVDILAAADLAGVEYLVSWDRRDFLKAAVRDAVKCAVVDPGEYLRSFRDRVIR